MRLMVICFAALLCSVKSKAQVTPDEFTTLFAFQVHTIDDFFERFNFKKNTGFQNFIKNNYPDYELTRKKLIRSLFNLKSPDFKADDASDFILQVTDSLHPRFAKYKDPDWYAELRCSVVYKNKPKKLTLILKVEQSARNTFRWSVVSARADFLNYKHTAADSINYLRQRESMVNDTVRSTKYFLSPVSHGLDFMDLDNVFINKTHVNDYIYCGQRSIELNRLILQIQKSEIKFGRINSVKYHLLQVNDWIMIIDYFDRDDRNSGWLITKLLRTSQQQKDDYLLTRLNIPK